MPLASCFPLEMQQYPRRCRIHLPVMSIWPQGAHLREEEGRREREESEKEFIFVGEEKGVRD